VTHWDVKEIGLSQKFTDFVTDSSSLFIYSLNIGENRKSFRLPKFETEMKRNGMEHAEKRDPITKKRAISVGEFAKCCGLSRAMAYRMVSEQRILSVRFGRKILIPVAELERVFQVGAK